MIEIRTTIVMETKIRASLIMGGQTVVLALITMEEVIEGRIVTDALHETVTGITTVAGAAVLGAEAGAMTAEVGAGAEVLITGAAVEAEAAAILEMDIVLGAVTAIREGAPLIVIRIPPSMVRLSPPCFHPRRHLLLRRLRAPT